MIYKMLPVLLMRHYNNPLHLEKAHSDRPMRHSFIWCAYGAWRGPNLITDNVIKYYGTVIPHDWDVSFEKWSHFQLVRYKPLKLCLICSVGNHYW